jgi:hypothetical protein
VRRELIKTYKIRRKIPKMILVDMFKLPKMKKKEKQNKMKEKLY